MQRPQRSSMESTNTLIERVLGIIATISPRKRALLQRSFLAPTVPAPLSHLAVPKNRHSAKKSSDVGPNDDGYCAHRRVGSKEKFPHKTFEHGMQQEGSIPSCWIPDLMRNLPCAAPPPSTCSCIPYNMPVYPGAPCVVAESLNDRSNRLSEIDWPPLALTQ